MKLILVLATAGCAVLAGCGGSPEQSEKTGATVPIELKLASTDVGTEDIPAVQAFADAIGSLSHGRLHVTIQSVPAAPAGTSDDLNAIDQVATGAFALGWVGTRSMAAAGAPAYAALGAPMLLDSYPVERAVVTDQGVLEALLPGTESTTKVTGLALLADHLRRPYSMGAPLVGPADYVGKTLWVTLGSREQEATLAALGADQAVLKPGHGLNAGLRDGSVDGLIFDPKYIKDDSMTPASLTANVAFWPRTIVLIGNPTALEGLSKADRAIVQEAASRSAQASLTIGDDDDDLIVEECQNGMAAVLATDAQLSDLRRAVQPVYEQLATDSETRALVERIESIKQTVTAPPTRLPAECAEAAVTSVPTPVTPAASPTFTDDPTPLDGTYRVRISTADVRDVGFGEHTMPDGSGCPVADCIAENVGIFTFTFRDGKETGSQRSASQVEYGDWTGRYAVAGDHVTILEDGGTPYTFRWAKEADGSLTLTPDPELSKEHPGLWYLYVRPLVAAG